MEHGRGATIPGVASRCLEGGHACGSRAHGFLWAYQCPGQAPDSYFIVTGGCSAGVATLVGDHTLDSWGCLNAGPQPVSICAAMVANGNPSQAPDSIFSALLEADVWLLETESTEKAGSGSIPSRRSPCPFKTCMANRTSLRPSRSLGPTLSSASVSGLSVRLQSQWQRCQPPR